jgi:hypothetical protein
MACYADIERRGGAWRLGERFSARRGSVEQIGRRSCRGLGRDPVRSWLADGFGPCRESVRLHLWLDTSPWSTANPLDPRSLRQLFARFPEYAAQSARALPPFCFGVGVRWCAQTTSATLRDATAARDSHLDRCRAFESHALSEIILGSCGAGRLGQRASVRDGLEDANSRDARVGRRNVIHCERNRGKLCTPSQISHPGAARCKQRENAGKMLVMTIPAPRGIRTLDRDLRVTERPRGDTFTSLSDAVQSIFCAA